MYFNSIPCDACKTAMSARLAFYIDHVLKVEELGKFHAMSTASDETEDTNRAARRMTKINTMQDKRWKARRSMEYSKHM